MPIATIAATSHSHSVLEVDLHGERSQGFSQNAGMVALSEHVEVHSLLVLEPDSLCLLVCVERVHENQRDVTVVLLVQELCVWREGERNGKVAVKGSLFINPITLIIVYCAIETKVM